MQELLELPNCWSVVLPVGRARAIEATVQCGVNLPFSIMAILRNAQDCLNLQSAIADHPNHLPQRTNTTRLKRKKNSNLPLMEWVDDRSDSLDTSVVYATAQQVAYNPTKQPNYRTARHHIHTQDTLNRKRSFCAMPAVHTEFSFRPKEENKKDAARRNQAVGPILRAPWIHLATDPLMPSVYNFITQHAQCHGGTSQLDAKILASPVFMPSLLPRYYCRYSMRPRGTNRVQDTKEPMIGEMRRLQLGEHDMPSLALQM
ncbi:hypothetical protein DFH27DRAFT_601188 [Peziza echinospora]|nr:hypothetical protein DFH27DRAFT_601188 [Peziza echinospora]